MTDDASSGTLSRVLLRLDGTRTAAEIAKELDMRRVDVEAVLDQLRVNGVLDESGSRSALQHYVDLATPALRTSQASKHRARDVLLLGSDELVDVVEGHLTEQLEVRVRRCADDDPAWTALTSNDPGWTSDGIATAEMLDVFAGWRDYFIVLATTVPDPISAKVLNRVAIELGIPWLYGTLDGPLVTAGPMFLPPSTSCYECFETRVTMNLRDSDSYLRYKRALVENRVRHGKIPLEPALIGLLASHLAMEVINYAATGSGFTNQKALCIYLPTMEIAFNEVLRLPGCPSCGSVLERDERELFFDVRALVPDAVRTARG
ncbi:TOMM precursor leader peptide-binding protein [Nocardia sp. NPDC051570]|uniref:TOMM precursor leader peptide-binding protein n=1 Tax=Nocardia sp. NPDC051570 TaxID=3364324 RepID=UPI0037B9E2B8